MYMIHIVLFIKMLFCMALHKNLKKHIKTLNSSELEELKDGIYHIQRANSYHSRLKGWFRGFN